MDKEAEAEPPIGERFALVGGVAAGIVLLLRMLLSSPVLDLAESPSFFSGLGSRVLKDPMEFVELRDPDLSLRPADSLCVRSRDRSRRMMRKEGGIGISACEG